MLSSTTTALVMSDIPPTEASSSKSSIRQANSPPPTPPSPVGSETGRIHLSFSVEAWLIVGRPSQKSSYPGSESERSLRSRLRQRRPSSSVIATISGMSSLTDTLLLFPGYRHLDPRQSRNSHSSEEEQSRPELYSRRRRWNCRLSVEFPFANLWLATPRDENQSSANQPGR